MRKPKLVDKKRYKKSSGGCKICGESDYNLLDIHRIIPGSEGGRYTKFNVVTLCSKCHRLVHAGKIEIEGYYMTSLGRKLKITKNGKEEFI